MNRFASICSVALVLAACGGIEYEDGALSAGEELPTASRVQQLAKPIDGDGIGIDPHVWPKRCAQVCQCATPCSKPCRDGEGQWTTCRLYPFAPGCGLRSKFLLQFPPPDTLLPGQTSMTYLWFENTGEQTWKKGKVTLRSQNPAGSTTWGVSVVQLTKDVPPGGMEMFAFQVTAPATPSTYNFQWQLHSNGGCGFFGARSANEPITVRYLIGDTNHDGCCSHFATTAEICLQNDVLAGGRRFACCPGLSAWIYFSGTWNMPYFTLPEGPGYACHVTDCVPAGQYDRPGDDHGCCPGTSLNLGTRECVEISRPGGEDE